MALFSTFLFIEYWFVSTFILSSIDLFDNRYLFHYLFPTLKLELSIVDGVILYFFLSNIDLSLLFIYRFPSLPL